MLKLIRIFANFQKENSVQEDQTVRDSQEDMNFARSSRNWSVIAALLMSGFVALVSGAYLLIA